MPCLTLLHASTHVGPRRRKGTTALDQAHITDRHKSVDCVSRGS